MERERKNGNQLMNDLDQMRRHLDELRSSMSRQLPAKEIDRLFADLREVNERLVIASLDNLDRAKAALAEAEAALQRLQAVLEMARAGVLIAEAPSGKVVLQNARVEEIWRRPLPQPSTLADYREYDGSHPDGRPYRPEEWPLARSIQEGETVLEEEITVTRGDGTRGMLLSHSAPLRGRRGRIVAGVMVLQDVTDIKTTAAHLAHLEAVTTELAEAATTEEVAGILLNRGIEALGASAGTLALLTEDGSALRLVGDTGYPGQALEPYRFSPIDAPIPIAEAIRTGLPIFLRSLEERVARFPNLRDVATENRAFAAVPMLARGRAVGALGLSFLETRELTGPERALLENLARQGALALLALGAASRESADPQTHGAL